MAFADMLSHLQNAWAWFGVQEVYQKAYKQVLHDCLLIDHCCATMPYTGIHMLPFHLMSYAGMLCTLRKG